MQLDFIVSPHTFVWNPYLTLTRMTFDLYVTSVIQVTIDHWFLSTEFFSSDFSSHGQLDWQQQIVYHHARSW